MGLFYVIVVKELWLPSEDFAVSRVVERVHNKRNMEVEKNKDKAEPVPSEARNLIRLLRFHLATAVAPRNDITKS